METLRARNSEEVKNDTDTQQLMSYYNEEVSQKLKLMPKYQAFSDWCDENGVLHPGVDFPAAFGRNGELIGMAAAKDLPPSSAFLYIPQEILINKHTIKMRAPDLWEQVYDKNPEIFKTHYDFEYLRIIVYVFHEMLKGEASFWFRYFQVITSQDIPMMWTQQELSEFQDAVLIASIQTYRKDFEEEYELVFKVISKYPQFFPGCEDPTQQDFFYNLFTRAYNSVVTRCFGWGLPCTTMVPFADFINHHNVDSSYELISRQMNPGANGDQIQSFPKAYFTVSKKEVNYSDFYSEKIGQSTDLFVDQIDLVESLQNKNDKLESEDFLIQNNKSLNWIKLVQLRQEARCADKTFLRLNHAHFNIWDLDYLSSSDEEDNDEDSDSDSNNSDQEYSNKKKVKRPKLQDVVDKLIERDKRLKDKDMEARVRKLKMQHKIKSRIFTFDEVPEDYEHFKKWWDPSLKEIYFSMHCRHRTSYRKGDQLFNSYGVRNNRHLITNYGFCLRNNKYNSLGFKVFVSTKDDALQTQRHVKILRLKKNRISEPLFQYLRANLIVQFKEKLMQSKDEVLIQRADRLLVSAPVDIEFEVVVLETAIGLVSNMLKTKFATTIAEDQQILQNADLPWRYYLAVTHRLNQKEILQSQHQMMAVLLVIIKRIFELNKDQLQLQLQGIKACYMKPVEDFGESLSEEKGKNLMVANRLRMRYYLRELNMYSEFT